MVPSPIGDTRMPTREALPADHAIARLARVFLRTGAKYAALIGLVGEPPDPAAKDRAAEPDPGQTGCRHDLKELYIDCNIHFRYVPVRQHGAEARRVAP
jgi:hypothetical protein